MTPVSEPSDVELMVAVRRGELDALDRLFARHHRRLYAFLVRLTHDRDVADDLVQEVFLRLLRFRESFRDDREFIPWLFRIARNLAADRFRSSKRTESVEESDFETSTSDDALDDIITLEEHARLDQVLASLPVSHREILLLRGVEQMSHRDIAEVLGCSEGAARVRVHRALESLKSEWQAQIRGIVR